MPYGRKRWQNAGCCVRGVHQGFKNVEQGWVEVLQRPWDRQTIMTRSHGKRKLPQVIQSEGEDLEGSWNVTVDRQGIVRVRLVGRMREIMSRSP